jgi:predicted HTH transcriptional regulator
MLTTSEVQALLSSGESQTVEFKTNIPFPGFLARLLSAFANAQGGVVLIGVREPNTIVGVDPQRFELSLRQALLKVQGHIEIEHALVQVHGKQIGVVQVKSTKSLVGSSEGYFVRVGSNDHPLSAQQLAERVSSTSNPVAAIETLSETVAAQTSEIAKLGEAFEKANSWKRKAFYALVGAAGSVLAKAALVALGVTGG